MIVIDTSAVIAIVADEPMAATCSNVLKQQSSTIISAGTLTELLIVAARRGLLTETRDLIEAFVTDIIDLTPERAEQAAAAYVLWGKTLHPAALNFGDCFSYATAREFACPSSISATTLPAPT